MGALTIVVGLLAGAVRYIAHSTKEELKELKEATSANTKALQAIELRLVDGATKTAMTAMGERITAERQAAIAEQNNRIDRIKDDVTIMKYVFDKGPSK